MGSRGPKTEHDVALEENKRDYSKGGCVAFGLTRMAYANHSRLVHEETCLAGRPWAQPPLYLPEASPSSKSSAPCAEAAPPEAGGPQPLSVFGQPAYAHESITISEANMRP